MKKHAVFLGFMGIVLLSSFGSDSKWVGHSTPFIVNNDTISSELKDGIVGLEDSLNIVALSAETDVEESLELIALETKASYYHDKFIGKKTASGLVFDNNAYTAAHRTLPFGTKIKVTNLKNDKYVILTITDRGPFTKGRGVDITRKAFMELADKKGHGILNVKIEKVLSYEG